MLTYGLPPLESNTPGYYAGIHYRVPPILYTPPAYKSWIRPSGYADDFINYTGWSVEGTGVFHQTDVHQGFSAYLIPTYTLLTSTLDPHGTDSDWTLILVIKFIGLSHMTSSLLHSRIFGFGNNDDFTGVFGLDVTNLGYAPIANGEQSIVGTPGTIPDIWIITGNSSNMYWTLNGTQVHSSSYPSYAADYPLMLGCGYSLTNYYTGRLCYGSFYLFELLYQDTEMDGSEIVIVDSLYQQAYETGR